MKVETRLLTHLAKRRGGSIVVVLNLLPWKCNKGVLILLLSGGGCLVLRINDRITIDTALRAYLAWVCVRTTRGVIPTVAVAWLKCSGTQGQRVARSLLVCFSPSRFLLDPISYLSPPVELLPTDADKHGVSGSVLCEAFLLVALPIFAIEDTDLPPVFAKTARKHLDAGNLNFKLTIEGSWINGG